MSSHFAVPIIFRALESYSAASVNARANAWEALSTRQIGDIIATAIYGIRERYDENLTVARILQARRKMNYTLVFVFCETCGLTKFAKSNFRKKKCSLNAKKQYCTINEK